MQRDYTILFKLIFVYAFVSYISMWHFANKKHYHSNQWNQWNQWKRAKKILNSMPVIDRSKKQTETNIIYQNQTINNPNLYTTTFSDLSQYNTINDFDKKMTNNKFKLSIDDIANDSKRNIEYIGLRDLRVPYKNFSDTRHTAKLPCFSKIAVWYLPSYVSQLSLQSSFLSDHFYFLMHFVNYWQVYDKKVLMLIIEEDTSIQHIVGQQQKTSRSFQSSQLKFDLDHALRACYKQNRCLHVKCALHKQDKSAHTFQDFDTNILQIVKKINARQFAFKATNLENDFCHDNGLMLDAFESSFTHCQPISQALVLQEKATNLAISVNFDTFEKALHAPSGFTCLEQQNVLHHRHCLLFTLKVL